jgi:phage tail-like protein
MPAKEPRPANHFTLKLGGNEVVGVFREISLGTSETEVIDHKYTDEKGKPSIRRVPGINKAGNITLKRGIDENLKLWQWRQEVIDNGPDAARVDGTIQLLDYKGSPIATYTFLQGWPIKYDGGTFSATSNEIALEVVEIAHEGLKRM